MHFHVFRPGGPFLGRALLFSLGSCASLPFPALSRLHRSPASFFLCCVGRRVVGILWNENEPSAFYPHLLASQCPSRHGGATSRSMRMTSFVRGRHAITHHDTTRHRSGRKGKAGPKKAYYKKTKPTPLRLELQQAEAGRLRGAE